MFEYALLYSFRRCPYVIRARLALRHAKITVQLREVDLKDKPQTLLKANPNGTVPTLILPSGQIINESLDIVNYCAQSASGSHLQYPSTRHEHMARALVQQLPDFIQAVNGIKYADRYPEQYLMTAQSKANHYLSELSNLPYSPYLLDQTITQLDINVFPFVRQLHIAEPRLLSAYPTVLKWLHTLTTSPEFIDIMIKFPPWHPHQEPTLL